MVRRSAPRCSRCVANECRSACGLTPSRAGDHSVAANEPINAAHAQAPAAEVHEQRFTAAARRRALIACTRARHAHVGDTAADEQFTILQLGANSRGGRRVERHEPLLAALAEDPHHPRAQVDVVEVEAGELARAAIQTRRTARESRDRAARAVVVAGRIEQRDISSSERCAGIRTSRFGVAMSEPGSSSMMPFTAQITEERAHRRQLARRAWRATAPACSVGQKAREWPTRSSAPASDRGV